AMIVEIATERQATMPMKRSLRTRRPSSQLMAAPASGVKMMRLRRWLLFTNFASACSLYLVLCAFDVCGWLTIHIKVQSTKHQSSKSQTARIIDIQRLARAKDGDDD